MKRQEAKSAVTDEQLALPFDRSPKAICRLKLQGKTV